MLVPVGGVCEGVLVSFWAVTAVRLVGFVAVAISVTCPMAPVDAALAKHRDLGVVGYRLERTSE